MTLPRTLCDKIWDGHVIDRLDDGICLIGIDRHLIHEVTTSQAFEGVCAAGRRVRHPELTLAVPDHNVPTTDRAETSYDPASAAQIALLARNAANFDIEHIDLDAAEQGIEAIRATPGNIFDVPRNQGAPILIAGCDFGCGSSREHAPWALVDLGFRAIVAPNFAHIFAGNAFKNGLLLVTLAPEAIERLLAMAAMRDITIDLPVQTVTIAGGEEWRFAINPFQKRCLAEGLNQIDITKRFAACIDAYKARRRVERSWARPACARADLP